MPIARVQMPDGRIARLEVPEGTTPEQAQQYAEDVMALPSVMDNAKPKGSSIGRFVRGLGVGLRQPVIGLGQRIGTIDEKDVDLYRKLNAPLMETTAGKVGGVVGAALPAVGASVAMRRFVNPTTLLGNMAQEGALGAAQGALTPTGTGETPITNVGLGAAGGAAAGGIAHGVSRLMTPFPNITPQRRYLLEQADDLGVPVTPAQATGSRTLRAIEHAAGSTVEQEHATKAAFNRLAARALGLPDDVDALTPEVLRVAELQNTAARNQLVANTALDTQGSPEFTNRLRDLIMNYQLREGPARSPEQANWLRMMADWYRRGNIPGDVYQANREIAGRMARVNNENQHFMSEIVDLMDSARPPGLEQQWREVNRQYRNLVQLNRPTVIDPDGNVKPSALWNIAQGQRGRGDLTTVGAIGKAFPPLPEPSHNSMAAAFSNPVGRAIAGSTVGGGASYYYGQREPGEVLEQSLLGGMVGVMAPSILQGMITSGPGRAYLTHGLLGGRNLAPALLPLSPFGAVTMIQQNQ